MTALRPYLAPALVALVVGFGLTAWVVDWTGPRIALVFGGIGWGWALALIWSRLTPRRQG